MKILFIGSGCACRLPFAARFFKKTLQEEQLKGVEVESADLAVWGVIPGADESYADHCEQKAGEVLRSADLIVVMEERQRNLLTRFLDYSCWDKIHLFLDYCKAKKGMVSQSLCGYPECPTQDEVVGTGCKNLIEDVRRFLARSISSLPMVVTKPLHGCAVS